MPSAVLEPLCLVGVGFWERTVDGDGAPAAALLGARARGRASSLTLMFAEVAEQAARSAHFEWGQFASIYGSALGEMERLMQLLEGLHSARREVSPLRFQTSVHNAAAGQLSIATHNHNFSTSLAAGEHTVALGFVEAAAWMQCHQSELLLVLGDEAPPPTLHPGPSYPPLAAAFAFSPATRAPTEAPRLRLRREPPIRVDAPKGRILSHNPCEPLRPLMAWLAREPSDIFSLSNAGLSGYCLERS